MILIYGNNSDADDIPGTIQTQTTPGEVKGSTETHGRIG